MLPLTQIGSRAKDYAHRSVAAQRDINRQLEAVRIQVAGKKAEPRKKSFAGGERTIPNREITPYGEQKKIRSI